MFVDRKDAGRELAEKLRRVRSKDAIVLALPRGGVVLGYEIANILSLPLDSIAVRKIGHPGSSEFALGAVDDKGMTMLDEGAAMIDPAWIKAETARQKKEAQRRKAMYRQGRRPLKIEGKVAIIVDDGIATGLTMRLAVRVVKKQKPEKLIVAVPVAPPESIDALYREGADEVIVLEPPEDFLGAVGAHYARFDQVEDEEVIRLLKAAAL
ncbi:phosphoribosyl transferase [Candidatus Kaiserbacteria bacterium CG10_big_fil_rev_8_21_14_0_10_51_14]|uniref:Phosphoribosyl transferase n=1 Tax=Candidatus Kaiserbacteria bacterium CG10_big_fil_rev_8_21_14_0_10_51_14 TaxID=1974610 RepID=A0A2H0UC86_9BACT|nr:MAG: phosphoribosyl transferase [Candidatus Kaiserbacteria bacterium CG10_big_fil_rev_8_21_14_0_10_51_14]